MGKRKRDVAKERKEANKKLFIAKLNNCPTSPRKMRLVADSIRGLQADRALNILRFNAKQPAARLEKLLLSSIANWQAKNEGVRMENAGLYVKEIFVDSGRQLKRLRPAPQGRGYRIRKRSNHITLILGSSQKPVEMQSVTTANTEKKEPVTAQEINETSNNQ